MSIVELVDMVSYFATSDMGFVKKVVIGGVYNKHNDGMGYYIVWETELKKYKISDDGDTLFDIIPEPAVKIKKILDKYEISTSGNELFLYADKDALVEKEKSFKAALTEIANLINIKKQTYLFLDEFHKLGPIKGINTLTVPEAMKTRKYKAISVSDGDEGLKKPVDKRD